MRVTAAAGPNSTWGPEAFLGGHLALDFTNTVGGYRRERAERLNSYADLLAWASAAHLVDVRETETLAALAEGDPDGAVEVLKETREQREAMHRWLRAPATGEQSTETDRTRIADDVTEALRAARLATTPSLEPVWLIAVEEAGLALPSRRVGLATGALLSGEDRHHVALCGRCSWLFLDPSPSRRRRWCSMTTCGNRAKAARHHARSS
jgi:predicted RNA-binding Zn ribbon-like protein